MTQTSNPWPDPDQTGYQLAQVLRHETGDEIGFAVTRETGINGLVVVVSEYGPGGVYYSLNKAHCYMATMNEIIQSREYIRYRDRAVRIHNRYGINMP